MKKLIIGSIALIALIVVYLLLERRNDSGVQIEDVDFAVEEASKIDRILMSDRSENKVELAKNELGVWMVNDEYPAFQKRIDIFLNETLSDIKVKGPVAKTAKENVIRSMISNSIKVDLYSGDSKVKSYYVGDHTPDMKGTYLHMEGSESPYIGYIPGHEGYIQPLFNLVDKLWFDPSIFDYNADSIKTVEVIYTEDLSKSFKLEKDGENFKIEPPLPNFSQQAAKSYFALFSFKNFEGYADYLSTEVKDSIQKSFPMIKVLVEDIEGNRKELNVFPKGKPGDFSLKDDKGNVLAHDPERYYATFTGFDQLVTIQEYTFGKILAQHSDFTN